MTMPLRTFEPEDFTRAEYRELFESDALFLSASEPYHKDTPLNAHYLATAKPRYILDAVSYLSQFAFQRDITLVFGGHPAISPMVLDVARRFGRSRRKRVAVFQTAFFRRLIPKATLDLAAQQYGELVWTEEQPGKTKDERERRSLRWMREVMLQTPKLIGGVFIGGMEGVDEEGGMIRDMREELPCFAIGTTGSAAADLLGANARGFSGRRATAKVLRENRSYPVVMQRIFEDLKRP